MAGVGHLKRICKDAFHVAGAVQETCSSEMLGGPGIDSWEGLHFVASDLQFWEDDFAWQVQDFVSFRGRRSTLDRWSGTIAKCIGTRPSALHSTFQFWRKSRRIAAFLVLSTSKLEEVSKNCFVFDVANFEIEEVSQNSSSRIEEVSGLLRCWCCQVQKLRKSRRIASFPSLQIDR